MADSSDGQSLSPLFTLDLGSNGGVFEPRTVDDLMVWLNQEINFWSWVNQNQGIAGGNTLGRLQQPIGQLQEARNQLARVQQYPPSDRAGLVNQLTPLLGLLRTAYTSFMLPHSSSTVGKRIQNIAKTSQGQAIGYAFTKMQGTSPSFDSQNMDVFAGFLQGLFEKYDFPDLVGTQTKAAAESTEELKAKIERLFARVSSESDRFQQDHAAYSDAIEQQKTLQNKDFEERSSSYDSAFAAATSAHATRMQAIESTFKEEMRLRGPVSYWAKRSRLHTYLALGFGVVSFGGIAALAAAIWNMSHELFGTLKAGQNPGSWQITSLVLVAVFGAWGMRLIVRLFLSNSHLATDAAERVVMTQTYLALLEESKLTEEKDRSLVLAALFRPSSDGMVKDENIPNPMLDVLTKVGIK